MNSIMYELVQVEKHELEEILFIYERKNSLNELLMIVSEEYDNDLKNKILNDIKDVDNAYSSWWKKTKEFYQWNLPEETMLKINFQTGIIYSSHPLFENNNFV